MPTLQELLYPEMIANLGPQIAPYLQMDPAQFAQAYQQHRALPNFQGKQGAALPDTQDVFARGALMSTLADNLGLPTDSATNLFTAPGEGWQSRYQMEQATPQTPPDPNTMRSILASQPMPESNMSLTASPTPQNPAQFLAELSQLRDANGQPVSQQYISDRLAWQFPQLGGTQGFPTGESTQGSGYGRTPITADQFSEFGDLFGLGDLASIPDITLGQMPEMTGGWAPGFEDAFRQNAAGTSQDIADIFNGMQLPNAQAASIDIGHLPELNATQMGQSPALQRLLSGQGFDPATLARLNAGATDTISRQAGANRGSARLALQQAGLGGSPAEAAVLGQINRQRGDATTQAQNQIAIEDAGRGLENFRMGAEMDFGREGMNMQAANAMALARASQMLSSMQQNASQLQQANMANFSAGVGRQMESAGRQADVTAGAGRELGTASINRQNTADQQNAANRFNWQLNQAQLDRGADTTNANLQQGQWQTGVSGLLGLAGLQNPANYTNQGNALLSQQGQNNSLIPSALVNIGANLLDRAQS